MAAGDVDHTRAKAKCPQANGICERVHRTLPGGSRRVAVRGRARGSPPGLQADGDAWLGEHNTARTCQGRCCSGRTPMQAAPDTMQAAEEKLVHAA